MQERSITGYFPGMTTTLAERIQSRLDALGKTASGASQEAGLNAGFIGDILKGKAKNPRSDTMAKIATALETTPEWLTLGDEDAPPPVIRERPASNVRYATIEPPQRAEMVRDVPIRGTAAGSLGGSFQITGEDIDYVARPPALRSVKGLYALYVEGESMVPAHNPGDLRFVHPNKPPLIGDTVIITAKYTEGGPYESFIKTLERRSGSKITVTQMNPKATIEFDTRFVASMHKVLTMNDLFGI